MPTIPRRPPVDLDARDRTALTLWLASVVTQSARRDDLPPAPADPRHWRAVAALAEGHGVAALVAPDVLDGAPGDARAAIANAAARTLARGRRMAADAASVQAALTAASIPFAFLKGAWLAPRIYDPPAARPMADIDIVVPPVAAAAAGRALAGLGYAHVGTSRKHRRFLRPDNHAVVDGRGEHPDNPRPVEVHTRVAESFRGIGMDVTTHLDIDRPAADWPLALALVHVAMHTTADMLGRRLRLIQLLDVARLAPVLAAADWAAVRAVAATPPRARFVWPALALAGRIAGAPIDAATVAALRTAVRPSLAAWVAVADVDALGHFGRDGAARDLLEVPRIWPRSAAEALVVWRFIALPGRWDLADRYPDLARGPLWPLVYIRHAGFTAALAVKRWRQRSRRGGSTSNPPTAGT